MEIKLKVDPCRESLIYYSAYGFQLVERFFFLPPPLFGLVSSASIFLSSSLMEILPFSPQFFFLSFSSTHQGFFNITELKSLFSPIWRAILVARGEKFRIVGQYYTWHRD